VVRLTPLSNCVFLNHKTTPGLRPRKLVSTPSTKMVATPLRPSSHHSGGYVIIKMTAIVAALTLAIIVWKAHARTLISRQAVTVRLRSALSV